MGQSQLPYQSKDQKIFQRILSGKDPQFKEASKRDGTVLRSKEEIVKDYDESNLPYPLRPLMKLDYCWRLTYTLYRHSYYIGIHLTMVYFIWTEGDKVWRHTWKTFPFKRLVGSYLLCVLLINAGNAIWSLAFEDYW